MGLGVRPRRTGCCVRSRRSVEQASIAASRSRPSSICGDQRGAPSDVEVRDAEAGIELREQFLPQREQCHVMPLRALQPLERRLGAHGRRAGLASVRSTVVSPLHPRKATLRLGSLMTSSAR